MKLLQQQEDAEGIWPVAKRVIAFRVAITMSRWRRRLRRQ
jgi:hypothetical protein